ncbi:MAG: putative DNA binding domain-containing protein [Bacteroidales bacterium]|nr:putative DNA binding domain-containing protein [Bacteroidales bacterium]
MALTIEDIITRKEGQTFDCKSVQIEPKALAVPIVAMANADGGTIAIGVSDKTRRIEGVDGNEKRLMMFDDRIVFETPGDLPGLVRPDNIRHTHFSRNPKIAQYLKAYKYVKEFGEGMDRIYRELNVNHTPEPKVHLDAFILKVTVRKNEVGLTENNEKLIEKVSEKVSEVMENEEKVIENEEKVIENEEKVIENHVRVIEKVTEKANNLGEKLTENKLQILRLVLANPYITKQEMAEAVRISVKSISANITAMRGKYLNRVGPDKGGFWEVMIE